MILSIIITKADISESSNKMDQNQLLHPANVTLTAWGYCAHFVRDLLRWFDNSINMIGLHLALQSLHDNKKCKRISLKYLNADDKYDRKKMDIY